MDGTNISTPAIDLDNKNLSLTLSGKRPRQEDDAAKKRSTTISPATEQTSGDGPPRQASISVAESEAATEHIAAGSNTMMSMESIVAELNAHSTDDARDVINAAQTILKKQSGRYSEPLKAMGRAAQTSEALSPHGNYQAGAPDGVDKACSGAEEWD